MTVQIIRQSVLENNSNRFVRNELAFKGTQIISQKFDAQHKTLNIVAVGKIISKEEIAKAEKMLESYNLEDYKLHIIQGLQSDSLLLANQQYSYSSGNTQASQQKLIEQVAQLGKVEQQLNSYQQYAILTKEVQHFSCNGSKDRYRCQSRICYGRGKLFSCSQQSRSPAIARMAKSANKIG